MHKCAYDTWEEAFAAIDRPLWADPHKHEWKNCQFWCPLECHDNPTRNHRNWNQCICECPENSVDARTWVGIPPFHNGSWRSLQEDCYECPLTQADCGENEVFDSENCECVLTCPNDCVAPHSRRVEGTCDCACEESNPHAHWHKKWNHDTCDYECREADELDVADHPGWNRKWNRGVCDYECREEDELAVWDHPGWNHKWNHDTCDYECREADELDVADHPGWNRKWNHDTCDYECRQEGEIDEVHRGNSDTHKWNQGKCDYDCKFEYELAPEYIDQWQVNHVWDHSQCMHKCAYDTWQEAFDAIDRPLWVDPHRHEWKNCQWECPLECNDNPTRNHRNWNQCICECSEGVDATTWVGIPPFQNGSWRSL